MFKQFWDKKKDIIQIVGSLIAIGALFLTIPIRHEEIADRALSNMQFFWIIIISVALIVLLINLLIFILEIETHYKENFSLDLDYSLSILFSFLSLYFLFNLWRYTSKVYTQSIKEYGVFFLIIFGMLISYLTIFIDKKYISKKKFFWFWKDCLLGLIAGIIFVIFNIFYTYSILENIKIGTLVFSFSSVFVMIFSLSIAFRFDRTKKIKEK